MVTFMIDDFETEIPNAWNYLLNMAYFGIHDDTEEIILTPYDIVTRWDVLNSNDPHLDFDRAWRNFDTTQYHVMPKLKKLHVPWNLFECLGVHSFMKERFPNCKVTYWNFD
jgi:hypothetical protein